MPTMTRCVLAPTLTRFIKEHPNSAVRIVEGYSAGLTQQVQNGDLDFAIVPAFPGAMGLRSRLFLRTPEVLVSFFKSPLTHAKPVGLRTLPGNMRAESKKNRTFTVNPVVEPRFGLDLIQIEPSRQVLSVAASAFLEILEQEASRLNKRWPPA